MPFHSPIAGSFLHAEQVYLLAEASASQSARYSRRIVTRDTSMYQVVCFQITIIKAQATVSVTVHAKGPSVYLAFVIGEAVLGVRS